MLNGAVVDAEAAADAIRMAAREAGRTAGVEVTSVVLALSGLHVEGVNGHGAVPVRDRSRVITHDDARRGIEAASRLALPAGREVWHVLPQDFVVDGQDGITVPMGLTCGLPLEANVHVVTVGTVYRRDLIACVNLAGLAVDAAVAGPVAASEATLTSDDKELGTALVDIGADTTSIAIFERGAVRHLRTLPVGAGHLSRDADVAPVSRPADAIELLRRVSDAIEAAGFGRTLHAGIVLTGGGAMLEGLPALAARVFDCPVRRGSPAGVVGLIDLIDSPRWATAVGLLLHEHRLLATSSRSRRTWPRWPDRTSLVAWLAGATTNDP